MKTIEQINEITIWLGENNKSTNIVKLSQSLNKLSILTITLSNDVATAYEVMNNLKDEYDSEFAKRFTEVTNNKDEKVSAAAAKPLIESQLVDKKKSTTDAQNTYKKMNMYLDRIDRIVDTYKQYISSLKKERENSKGQV